MNFIKMRKLTRSSNVANLHQVALQVAWSGLIDKKILRLNTPSMINSSMG